MEAEVEGRVKSLPYKVRSVSRESAAQKATHVLDPDLRTHWSTSTNTKEWLVLELEESCLLSHIRIHNKSVLEWEISIGLRFKPDTYLKVRPRCEAPRRDVTYHVGYQACCFVRISCLRGNPIAIFHIQLMGIPVPGLEPELQPVVDHVLPQIIARIRDAHDSYLQLLQDIASRLSPILSHLEVDLSVSSDAMESSIRFLAMLVGPFYPILMVLGGRENDKLAAAAVSEIEATKSSQASVFTVSSNFQAPPKRVRSPGVSRQSAGHCLALRPDAALLLLRVAYRDNFLGNLCRKVGKLLRKLNGSTVSGENSVLAGDSPSTAGGLVGSGNEEVSGASEPVASLAFGSDYSSIFGEEYKVLEDDGLEVLHAGILDVAAVEEGLLHVLYACAAQPIACRRLADSKSDLISVLPLIQAMLPALRPLPSTLADAEQVDETFWQWQAPIVQRAVSQVVALSTSPSYRPLLDACAGYLSSYSLAHEKAACVLIDLCAGPLAPWLLMVIAKVDLAIELLEDLLGVIQAGHGTTSYPRAALVYLILALSGHVDDVLSQYKDVKHHVLFLIEMLEPFLIPALTPAKSTIAFGDVSAVLLEKQEQTCALALDLVHMAIRKPAVLPAMEAEWRRGHVTPSVLLSILAPHVPQPPGIDLWRSAADGGTAHEPVLVEDASGMSRIDAPTRPNLSDEETANKGDVAADGGSKVDVSEDPTLLFAPLNLKSTTLPSVTSQFDSTSPDPQKFSFTHKVEGRSVDVRGITSGSKPVLDLTSAEEYFNLQAEYLQLVNSQERELRALEFTRFATELHSRGDASEESHQAAIDALLLAAECHLNPFFMVPSAEYQQHIARFGTLLDLNSSIDSTSGKHRNGKGKEGLEKAFWLEEERDKAVLRILMEAAEWDSNVEKISRASATESDDMFDNSTGVQIREGDLQAVDALTLVREHQELLCHFFVNQLKRERHNMYEVLLQGLLLILDSATQLSTSPAEIIEVILQCAERLNNSLLLYYNRVREVTGTLDNAGMYAIRRQWALLRRLVLVASGGRSIEETNELAVPEGSLLQAALIPAWAWMTNISKSASSPFPLVRYVGWMGLSRYAKYYKEIGLVLVSNVQQLTSLLLIFSDDLASVSEWKLSETQDILMEVAYKVATGNKMSDSHNSVGDQADDFGSGSVIKALHPELELIFPRLQSQFNEFAKVILESVCQLLKAVPTSTIPDLLSWFSKICSEPFPGSAKSYALANIRYVILYLLEVVVVEHMEAIVPELPRVLEVLLSLCRGTYSDVPLLESVLAVLKPIISYSAVSMASVEDYSQSHAPGIAFESLCFGSILEQLKDGPGMTSQEYGEPKSALLLFLAGSLVSDLSVTRCNELISSFTCWAKFTFVSSTNMYYNYLRAFQKILEECGLLLERLAGEVRSNNLEDRAAGRKVSTQALFALTARSDAPPAALTHFVTPPGLEAGSDIEDLELDDGTVELEGAADLVETQDDPPYGLNKQLPEDEQTPLENCKPILDSEVKGNLSECSAIIEEFKQKSSELVIALGPALENCWRIHPQLTSKVAYLGAKCLYFSGFQGQNVDQPYLHGPSSIRTTGDLVNLDMEQLQQTPSDPIGLLAVMILKLQEAHCWQVASVTMDFLLSLLNASCPPQALSSICAVLQYQCSHAPRVAWRLLSGKWLMRALPLAVKDVSSVTAAPLIRLLCVMLEHSEPEQRLGALQQLGHLVKDELNCSSEISPDEVLSRGSLVRSSHEGFANVLVASTWDKVATTAACDLSLGLRKEALELLLKFVPLAKPHQLQSFLGSSDTVLPNLTSSAVTLSCGPLTRIALMVLSRCCVYVTATDISMIPARVWDSICHMANAKSGGVFSEAERTICQALLQLRAKGEIAKQPIKDFLSGNTGRLPPDTHFTPVREAVLEVLARLSSVWSKEDCAASEAEELAKEMEEAEIELELVRKEQVSQKPEGVENFHEHVPQNMSAVPSGYMGGNPKEQLKQLKSQILAEEHASMRAAIAARREKQRIARRERQLTLEYAAFREIELLQELDRERAAEAGREIERQRTLERERAKTRELRHTLDLESERRTQREFQRELEQRESGSLRPSRRGEFASTSTPSSRPRERYREREREGGRIVQEISSRPSVTGSSGGRESGTTPPATPTAAGAGGVGSSTVSAVAAAAPSTGANSRAYNSGFTQVSRDREERGFEDSNADGNGIARETGDGNNFGDGEGSSGLDGGGPGSLAISQRQGVPRTSRPRQIVERRERDGRREGKWERKQT